MVAKRSPIEFNLRLQPCEARGGCAQANYPDPITKQPITTATKSYASAWKTIPVRSFG